MTTINYTPSGPVTRAFHASTAFVRGIKGPIGSGKSISCCMDIMMHALKQPAGRDGWARSRVVIVRNCFDPKTEILTKNRGWIPISSVELTDEVASLEGEQLVFVNPTYVHKEHYTGDLMGFEGEGVDFLVTPNHKLYVSRATTRKKVWGEFTPTKAQEVFKKSDVRMKRNAVWVGEGQKYTESVFELLGFWFAEGHAAEAEYNGVSRRRFILSQYKETGVAYLIELLGKAQVQYTRPAEGQFRISLTKDRTGLGDELFELVNPCGNQTTRAVPDWIKAAPAPHIRAFLRGFSAGDGHIRKDAITETLYTSSRALADDLQTLALKAGRVANISVRDRAGEPIDIGGRATAATTEEYTITLVSPKKYTPKLQRSSHKTQYRGWYKESYDGDVYCLTVPSHVVYVRRNGKAGWSSQCYPELKSTTIKSWLDWFPEEVFGKVKWDSPITHTLELGDKRVLEAVFLAVDRPEDTKKLLSLETTWLWLNEARELPKAVLDAGSGRVGRYPSAATGAGAYHPCVIMDTNPPADDHWWYRLAEEERPDSFDFFDQPSGLSEEAENLDWLNQTAETIVLPVGHPQRRAQGRIYYERLVAGKDPNWVKVYVKAEYGSVADGRAIFPEFNERIHVSAEPLVAHNGLPIYLGFDFGLCYSDDTEVLTDSGWKLFKDVDEHADLAATRNPETKELSYTPINFKVEYDYEGELLEWDSTEVNFCVTPEHRVPFTYRDSPDKVRFESAEWLEAHMGGHHYVDLRSEWVGSIPNKLPVGMAADDFCRFMGWWCSDGSVTHKGAQNRVSMFQTKPTYMRDFISALCGSGVKWEQYVRGTWVSTDKALAAYLREQGKKTQCRIPAEIRAMPPEQIRIFLDAYAKGDGHTRTRKNKAVEQTIYCPSYEAAGVIQELAQKAGWNSSLRTQQPKTSAIIEAGVAREIVGKTEGYVVTIKKRASRAELLRRNFKRVPYSGKIYCLNVPFHTLYIRRKGKPSWNGNTPACVISQLTPRGQFRVLDEVVGVDIGLSQFIDTQLKPHLSMKYPNAKIISLHDPAGTQRSQADEVTCRQILKNKGLNPSSVSTNAFMPRREAVAYFLTRLIDGEPAFILSPTCKVLRKALNGDYKFRRVNVPGEERYKDVPDKNACSHIAEALQYACIHFHNPGRADPKRRMPRAAAYKPALTAGY